MFPGGYCYACGSFGHFSEDCPWARMPRPAASAADLERLEKGFASIQRRALHALFLGYPCECRSFRSKEGGMVVVDTYGCPYHHHVPEAAPCPR